jgi:ribulose-5-phosphate 4-epimerase/fuculose-1-phosphate aldolase
VILPKLVSNRTQTAADPIQQARIDLAAAHRLAVLHGFHEGIDNHLTLTVPGRADQFLLIPYGLHWSEVSASDFMAVTYDGKIVEGAGIVEPTALCIHGPIHRLRADAACVLHTHMPFATALNLLEEPHLEMVGQTAAGFGGLIAYDADYTGIAYDPSEGERLAAAMGPDKTVLFMAHHGVVVIGETVAQAYDRLYFLERACQAQLYAMWTGRRLKPIPQAVLDTTIKQFAQNAPGGVPSYVTHFAALKRLLDRREPDYRD